MENTLSLVSIIVPTYNRVEVLKICLESIFKQDYQNIELIIVNDCSSDYTRYYLENLMVPLNIKLKLIHNEQNLKLQRTLNIGLRESIGKYIARLDDDDFWIDKSKLTRQVKFLEQNTNIGIVGTGYVEDKLKIFNPETDIEIRNQILFRCPFRHSTVVFRRAILGEIGLYNEELPYSEDWEYWLRIGYKYKFHNLLEATTAISKGNNASEKYFIKQIGLNQTMLKPHYSKYPRAIRARFYHFGLSLFFGIVPINSTIHKMAQKLFNFVFIR